jgi:ABC-type Fe3+-siderophore transport system permease subunit
MASIHNLHTTSPLPDIGHTLLPDLSRWYFLGDWILGVLCAVALAYCAWAKDWDLIVYIIAVVILGTVIKMVMTFVTVLPDPSGACHEKAKKAIGSCNDLLPSGHMIAAFAVCIGLWPRLQSVWWKAVFGSLTALLWFFTVATKNHYTIDTLVSFFVVMSLSSIIPAPVPDLYSV